MAAIATLALITLLSIVSGYELNNGTNICCGGAIGAMTDKCCGPRQPYNPSAMVCCDNQLFEVPGKNATNYSCCSGQFGRNVVYDTRTSICCSGNVLEVPGNDTTNYSCCFDTSLTGREVVAVPYNYRTSVCCMGRVMDAPDGDTDHYSCCSSSVSSPFDVGEMVNSMCCNYGFSTLSNYIFSYNCCAAARNQQEIHLYDYRTATCCDGKLTEAPSRDSRNYSCCSTDGFGWSSESFNRYTSVCCPGVGVFDKANASKDYGCCDNQLFDYETSMCCDSQVFNSSTGMACCDGRILYDTNTQICVKYKSFDALGLFTRVVNITDDENAVCDSQIYDKKKGVCCSGQTVVPNTMAIPNPQCCGTALYDPAVQTCCDWSRIVDAPAGSDPANNVGLSCCGAHAYNSTNQACCNGTVYERPSNSSGVCCGGTYFSVPGHIWPLCCGGKPFQQTAKYEYGCCGNSQAYNSTSQMCCGQTTYDRKSPFLKCCSGNTMYNSSTHMCSGFGVLEKAVGDIVFKYMGSMNQNVDECGSSFRSQYMQYYHSKLEFT